ncbi:MAG: hypothetical protein ACK5H1_10490 [Tenacibaculum sp.]
MKINTYLIKIISFVVILFSTISCTYQEIKKESTSALDQSSYNKIHEFKVSHQGQTFYADISDTEIVLNWPQNIELPNSITPAVTTLSNYKLSPASHVAINPREKVTYTLTPEEETEENTQKTYTFKINFLQPDIKIIEAEPVSLPVDASYGQAYSIYGEGFSLTKEENKVFLVSVDGSVEKLINIDRVFAQNNNGYADIIDVFMPLAEELKEGLYKLKISFGSKEVISENEYFHLKDRNIPYFDYVPEDKITEIDGIRCLVINYEDKTFLLKGENLDTEELTDGTARISWFYPNNIGQITIEITVQDSQTILVKENWQNTVIPNAVYNRGLSVDFGSFFDSLTVNLRDENGEVIGIYFEQK